MKRLALIGVSVALAAAAAAPAQGAGWSETPVPQSTGAIGLQSWAFGADGRGLLLWEGFRQPSGPRFTGVATLAPASSDWTRASDLSGIGWGNAQAVPYGTSRVLLASAQVTGFGRFHRANFRLVSIVGRTDGTLAAPRAIAPSTGAFALAANGTGRALVAFTSQRGTVVQVAERAPGKVFGTPVSRSATSAGTPAAAINARGDRVVAWVRRGRIEARVRPAGGAWGPVQRAGSAPRVPNVGLRALVTASGDAVLAWGGADVREDRTPRVTYAAAVRSSRATHWSATTLERGTVPTAGGEPPLIEPLEDAKGLVTVAWAGRSGSGMAIKLAGRQGRTFAAGTAVARADRALELADAASGPDGRLALLWSENPPGGPATAVVLLRAPNGTRAAPERLGTGIQGGLVAFRAPNGRPVVIRPVSTGTSSSLVADLGPA